MQIIQSIRDKGAAIVIVVITLSLIGFILMDAQQGGGGNGLFSSNSNDVGKVNGKAIELMDFNKKVKVAEDMQAQRSGQRPTGIQTYQVREQTWNQVVAEKVFFEEAEKLGIDFTAKELSYILLSNDQANPFLQEQGMRDSITGKLDIKKAQDALNNIKKLKGEQREGVNAQIVEPLKLSTTVAKYTGLLNASAYYPTWMQEKETAENNNFANISYVSIPYSDISDSTIKVTDEEINAYVKKNKELFKQEEEARTISYVAFSQLPAREDSVKTSEEVAKLKPEFEADSNAMVFVARNASVIDYSDDFQPKSKLSPAVADTLSNLSAGTVFGPYIDNGNYVLAKKLATKELPDSVNARHILISLTDRNTGKELYTDDAAKKLADSIYNAYLAGSSFAELASKFSADGSKDKGGDLGTFGYGTMVPEFNEFCFTKPAGSKGVVKTQFGYHIIDIVSQKDFKQAYKIAYLAKEISASDVTINKASLNATTASAEKNRESLEKYIAKNGLSLTQVPNLVKENDFSIGALQDARGLVRWAFEAKKGDVSEPFSIGDQFIVAVLDKVHDKGVQDAVTARPGSESIIRNKKKAEMIIKKLGNVTSLEAAASAYSKQVQVAGADSSLTFSSQLINGVGMESKVIGAAFNKEYQTKVSPPIEGTTGVFVIKVNSVQAKPAETPEAAAQKFTARLSAIRSQLNNWFEGLRKQATVKDTRSKHF